MSHSDATGGCQRRLAEPPLCNPLCAQRSSERGGFSAVLSVNNGVGNGEDGEINDVMVHASITCQRREIEGKIRRARRF